MFLIDLLLGIPFECLQGSVNVALSNLRYDSRQICKYDVFFCISGSVNDGHEYVGEAVRSGVVAIIVEKSVIAPPDITIIKVKSSRYALAYMSAAFFGHPAAKLKTIGITGTKGKTTTAYMVKDILEHIGYKTGLIGSIETIIGDTVIASTHTTPEAYVIQKTFKEMVKAGCDCVVMEVSSQGLMLDRVSGFTFDIGVFTNLEPDHIGPGEHKDIDDYIRCKSLLFRHCRQGIVNLDDKYVGNILAGHTCKVDTYGFSEMADLRADTVQLFYKSDVLGVQYKMQGYFDFNVKVNMPGVFTVYNSLAAIAVGRHFGAEERDIKVALRTVKIKGRVEIVPVSDKFTVIIDYAHNAMSLESLLQTLRGYHPKRLVNLFGCGGNRSKLRRYEMGEVSAKLADLTVVTSDNPRDEEPGEIIKDVLTGVKKAGGRYIMIEDRREAIKYCIKHARKGDMIVFAGKGHEDYQEIKGCKHKMDERDIIKELTGG